jgi:hypothetical protein
MIQRPKLSSLVESQLPEFVREEYSTFVDFLKAYYEFLDETNQDITALRDLDTTLDSFVGWFKNELAAKIPYSTINERFLLSHIKDLYKAKGSEASFHLLFKILYNKDVTVEYPSQQMLRASDGKWNQEISVFVEKSYGDQNSLVLNAAEVVTLTKTLRVEVERILPVINGSGIASNSTFEYILDRKYYGQISIGDTLRYVDENGILRFSGTILPTTIAMEVQNPGIGFKVGDLLSINNLSGHGSVLKVTKVAANGGLSQAQFIKFGVGYLTDFTTTLSAPSLASVTVGPVFQRIDTNIGGGNKNYALTISDRTEGFSETGGINTSDYNIDPFDTPAFDLSYSGIIVREWATSNQDSLADSNNQAIIKVTLGSVAKYPGYYLNNDGFLNDAIFIQDSKYYQAFSYVVKIDKALESYKSAVKNLIHPSGTALFGEYGITNEFTRQRTLESILKILNFRLSDAFSVVDSTPTFDISTLLSDGQLNYDGNIESQSVTFLDSIGIDTAKLADPDSITLDDISHLDITAPLPDEFSVLADALIGNAGFSGINSDSMITSEYTASDMSKLLAAGGHLLNDGVTVDTDAPVISDTDATSPTDLNRTTPTISYTTTIDPSYYGGDDNAGAVDSGGVLELNAYAENYFANDSGYYVGSQVAF